MPLILEVKNIAKKFGRIVALRDIDFKIDEGEFVYITGASGAGKTTLLKCILRQIYPDAGEIILDGNDIAKLPRKKIPELRQQIRVVFQDFKVLPERTVRENVEVALAVIGLPKKDWDARVDHVLHLVGLFDRSELFPNQLSGGELQRVSLARALVVNPKIILADEPTGNLDWETADKMIELFNLINHEGKTIIMATHNMQVVKKYKKRTIELKDGVVFKDMGVEIEREIESEQKRDKEEEKNDDKIGEQLNVVDESAAQKPEILEGVNTEKVGLESPPVSRPVDDLPPSLDVAKPDEEEPKANDVDKIIEHAKKKHNKKKLKKKKKPAEVTGMA